VQPERFAAAHSGAEQHLEQVGELVRVLGVVVAQERGGLAVDYCYDPAGNLSSTVMTGSSSEFPTLFRTVCTPHRT